jgi:dolichol-phosphate mannosyltransferase
MSGCSLSIICPCYNEAEVIDDFHARLVCVLDELAGVECRMIYVDDGSADETLDRLNQISSRDPRVRVYSFARNFGHQIALSAGLDAADTDAVILMDSDLQHPPELIPEIIQRWQDGHDVVSMVRRQTAGASPFKRWTSDGFYRLFNRFGGVRLEPGAADFCLLSRRAYEALHKLPERHRFLRGLVAWIGFKRCFIPYDARQRHAGTSKYSLPKMLRLAADAIFSFSAQPIRAATKFGLLVAGGGFLYLAYILARSVLLGDLVAGWGSLISVVLILGGLQLTFLGVLGEYVARIFEEVKGRPLYVLKQRPERSRLSDDDWDGLKSEFELNDLDSSRPDLQLITHKAGHR